MGAQSRLMILLVARSDPNATKELLNIAKDGHKLDCANTHQW